MEKLDTQPDWLNDAVGVDYYGGEIEDVYLATDVTRPYGEDSIVVMLELSGLKLSRGYWYYVDTHGEWYWSAGGKPPEVSRKVLDEHIKPNYRSDFQ
jgi:hypothetical protein